jgi:di/tricarboxylate transporter
MAGPLTASTVLATGVTNDLAWRFALGLGAIAAVSVNSLGRKVGESLGRKVGETPRNTVCA